MKIRNDFVSNSSSSSYIVAIDFDKYDFGLFVKKVREKCSDEKQTSEKPGDIANENEAALRSGMLRECLYLGCPVVGRIKEIWRRGEKYDHTFVERGESDEFTPFADLTDGVRGRYLSESETVKHLDDNTIEYEYDDELPAWRSVTRYVMENRIREGSYYAAFPGNSPKSRVARIIAYVKQKSSEKIGIDEPEIFCITRNTVKNTRDFLKLKHKIRFLTPLAASENLMSRFLDTVDARLKAGETFIYAVAGDGGEGRSGGRLFMPDGYSNPFETTPAQNVTKMFEEF